MRHTVCERTQRALVDMDYDSLLNRTQLATVRKQTDPFKNEASDTHGYSSGGSDAVDAVDISMMTHTDALLSQ